MISNYLLIGLVHFFCTFLFLTAIFHLSPSFLIDPVNCVLTLASVVFVGWCTFPITKSKWLNGRIQPDGKAVLITGCDRGFGQALAIRLDALGYHVFASCLSPSEPEVQTFKHKCSSRLEILEMDVTKESSVQAAFDFVKENLGISELWAIVNNAGVFKGHSVEVAPMDDFKQCIDVNTYGPIRVTKAFLPLLRQSRGRVINLTSIAGRTTAPGLTPYMLSKHAAVGFNDCLRQEMEVWGISVISVEPEIFQTSMADPKLFFKHFEENLANLDKSIKDDYGEDYFRSIRKLTKLGLDHASPKIENVVDDLVAAITKEYPDRVYTSSRNAIVKFLLCVYKILPLLIHNAIIKTGTFIILLKKLKPRSK